MPAPLRSQEIASFAKGLTLAGQPLQPPELHHTGWTQGQTFGIEDDPDRVTLPFEVPECILKSDPAERREGLKVHEVPFSKGFSKGSFARIVEGVLSEKQCAALIAATNKKGYTPALINIGRGVQMFEPGARDGHRVIADLEPFGGWLSEVLRDCLPERRRIGDFQGLNERMRFLCYTPGQSFPAHFDGQYRRPSSHPRAGDASQVTVQIYLHDVAPGAGGATTLFPGSKDEVPCQPKAGSALLFTQDLFHEGALVKKGLKYTIRTEAMYGPAVEKP